MRHLGLVMLLLLVPIIARADGINVEIRGPKTIRLHFTHAVPGDFCRSEKDCPKGQVTANYHLYEIVNADNENIKAEPRGISTAQPTGCYQNRCSLFDLTLSQDLKIGSTYLIKIDGVSDTATLTRFETSNEAKITTSFINAERRNEIAVQAGVSITPAADFKILRTVSSITKNTEGVPDVTPSPTPLHVSVMPKTPGNIIGVRLASKLQQGVSYDLSASGVVLNAGTRKDPIPTSIPVSAIGIIELPGVPEPPDDPKIDVTLSSLAARHQKAVFDLVANFTPLKRIPLGSAGKKKSGEEENEPPNVLTKEQQYRASHKYSTRWAIEPSAAIDVGFRSTKSNNSITLTMPFTRDFLGSNVKCFNLTDAPLRCGDRTAPSTKIPVYAGWESASLFHLGFVKFAIGPRLETDRKFKRINMLGEMRFDFNFTRFADAGTIGGRRKNLKSDLRDQAKFVEINWGFKMIPYVSFDFGGHVNNETVTNSDKNVSVFVPRHRIFRTYLGTVPTFQWKAFGVLQTLSLDESVVFMAHRETIGFTTDNGAELKSLRGFHPHSLIKWNIAIDPAGHYNLVTTYENGRLAPNFEYINKTTAGFRIVY